jgi:hypothetical protein
MSATHLEAYYEQTRQLTFASQFVPLTRDTAQALCAAHSQHTSDRAVPVRALWAASSSGGGSTALCQLATAVDAAMATLGCAHAFVRLSSRSPKDAPLDDAAGFRAAFLRELAWVEADEAGLTYAGKAENVRLHAVYRAMTYAMACTCGADAVDLLVRSDRIQDDLAAFAAGAIPDPFHVVVREFVLFDPDTELRAFVHNGRLTACTQYNEMCFFPTFAACLASGGVEQAVSDALVRDVLPVLPLRSAVVDLLLVRNRPFSREEHGPARFAGVSVRVVELNPLAEFASTGLFSWERDRATLLGDAPFEFRAFHAVPENPYESLGPSVRAFLDQAH